MYCYCTIIIRVKTFSKKLGQEGKCDSLSTTGTCLEIWGKYSKRSTLKYSTLRSSETLQNL